LRVDGTAVDTGSVFVFVLVDFAFDFAFAFAADIVSGTQVRIVRLETRSKPDRGRVVSRYRPFDHPKHPGQWTAGTHGSIDRSTKRRNNVVLDWQWQWQCLQRVHANINANINVNINANINANSSGRREQPGATQRQPTAL